MADSERFVFFVCGVLRIDREKVHDGLQLVELNAWDSLAHLVIASWIHQETEHLVSALEINSAKTLGELKAIYASKI